MFLDSISIHINIFSDGEVKLEDSTFNNICVFLKSQFDTMEVGPAWIAEALSYLVSHATSIFIWTTIVAKFLQVNSQACFFIFLSPCNRKRLGNLYSLYSTAIKASFSHNLQEKEIKAVISVMGAMIFAKKLLNDNTLIMLLKVKILDSDLDMLQFIQNGLIFVIDKGPIYHFHHYSFENFLLSFFFLQDLSELAAVQD